MRIALMLAFEGGLGVLAIILGTLFGWSPLARTHFDAAGVAAGVAATAPMLAILALVWRGDRASFAVIKDRICDAVRALFPRASLAQLACVSLRVSRLR